MLILDSGFNMVDKKDKLFNIAMLIMTIAISLGTCSFIVQGMNADVFAIDYRHGVSARGLIGSIFSLFCRVFGGRFYNYSTISWFCFGGFIMYLCFMWSFARKLIFSLDGSSHAKAFIMAITPFYITMFTSYSNYGRSDMILIILSIAAGLSVFSEKGIVFCVILPAVAILIHEGYIMTYYNIVVACLLYRCIFEKRRKSYYVLWTILSITAVSAIFIWLYFLSKRILPMNQEIYDDIIRRAEILTHESSYTHYSFIDAEVLGRDLYKDEIAYMKIALTEMPVFLILFSPFIFIGCRILKSIITESDNKPACLILCSGTISLIPMFLRKCDYGRWMFAFISYYLILMMILIIKGNTAVREAFIREIRKIHENSWETVFLSSYFMLLLPMRSFYCSDISVNIINLISNR